MTLIVLLLLKAPAFAEPALTRVAVCEAWLRVGGEAGPTLEAPSRALDLIGRDAAVIDPEVARFDVDTTLARLRRLPDGLSGHSVAVARLSEIQGPQPAGVRVFARELHGPADVERTLAALVTRARATDALVTTELDRLYPPDRGARRALRWAAALTVVPPAALAIAGFPNAAVLALPMALAPVATLHWLYQAFGREAARTNGLTRHAGRIGSALAEGRTDVVMYSGSVRVPYRLSRALEQASDPSADALEDMALVSEDGVRLPFEARHAPTDVEMREIFYDSVFVGGADPVWALITRVGTPRSTAPPLKTVKPAARRG